MSQSLYWNSKSPGKAEICDFQNSWIKKIDTWAVNENILGFEVSMNNSSWVAEIDPVDKLEHYEPYLLLRNGVFIRGQIFFEILLSILKHQMQLFFDWEVNNVY